MSFQEAMALSPKERRMWVIAFAIYHGKEFDFEKGQFIDNKTEPMNAMPDRQVRKINLGPDGRPQNPFQ